MRWRESESAIYRVNGTHGQRGGGGGRGLGLSIEEADAGDRRRGCCSLIWRTTVITKRRSRLSTSPKVQMYKCSKLWIWKFRVSQEHFCQLYTNKSALEDLFEGLWCFESSLSTLYPLFHQKVSGSPSERWQTPLHPNRPPLSRRPRQPPPPQRHPRQTRRRRSHRWQISSYLWRWVTCDERIVTMTSKDAV